jgi:hypothetical protein
MAYDETLAERVRAALKGQRGLSEKKMFGGLAFMLSRHMACGLVKDELMVRVGPEGYSAALEQPHARTMDFTGRVSKGMVFVAPAGLRADDDLRAWVQRGVSFVRTLPPK